MYSTTQFSSSDNYHKLITPILPTFKKPNLDLKTFNSISLAEFHPLNNPNYPIAILAGSETQSMKQDVITWNEVGSAMVGVAHKLRHTLESSPAKEPAVIGLIGHKDPLTYYAILLTIIRTGSIPLLISPRNSIDGIVHLIQASGCKHIYVEFDPDVKASDFPNMSISEKLSRDQIADIERELPKSHSLNLLGFPNAFELFPRLIKGSPYEFNHDLPHQLAQIPKPSQSEFAPVMILHSSGSTGIPKLIPLNRITFQCFLRSSDFGQFSWTGELISAMALPPYHALGVQTCFNVCLSSGLEYSKEPESIEFLKGVKRIAYGGAPLSVNIGNLLQQNGVKISSLYGITEVGIVSVCLPDPCYGADWEYFEISPQIKAQLEPHENGLCSLGFEKEFGPQTYHTSDLLEKHPTRSMYRLVGRLDDQITLSNSEKINPIPSETTIRSNHAINGVLLFGRGKPQIGVVIEPHEKYAVDVNDRSAVERYIDLIWPSIEEANKLAPAHGRITRNMILVIDPRSKSIPKNSKGLVSRPKTLQLLAEEIEAIYQQEPDDDTVSGLRLLDSSGKPSESSVTLSIKSIIQTVLKREVKVNDDLFLDQGCDSVHITSIRSKTSHLIKANTEKQIKIPTNVVYQYPSIEKMTRWLMGVLSEDEGGNHKKGDGLDPCLQLKAMIKKYLPLQV
ncbi:uncharacterized protein MELLADRAFT_79245 [Melampsora larici-populina 98AG31]|uniref:AMP-dependent synthetase/ligase domain-containing protein n=1 Tax=Melampsora larici-populina (strain 98AG31 / pathotype 3-4-7) TaxID=747676 RepID=F4S4Q4_MELLP|nr:uncharacterized protein MELLADRAFT_79245 [Melampsora larici-populina 98AG31]EGG00329.1 hypothetical protein MELLADRAFT_79245 [Melampsora larici-populina 98AG31]